MISNSGGLINLSESFEVLRLSVFFLFYRCRKHRNSSDWLCRQSSISVSDGNDLCKERKTFLQSTLFDLKNSLLQNAYGCPRGVINYNVYDVLNKHKDKPSEPTLTVPICNPCFTLFRFPWRCYKTPIEILCQQVLWCRQPQGYFS